MKKNIKKVIALFAAAIATMTALTGTIVNAEELDREENIIECARSKAGFKLCRTLFNKRHYNSISRIHFYEYILFNKRRRLHLSWLV